MSSTEFSPCQVKFAFLLDESSPLAWPEYFGFEDTFDMLYAYCERELKSETLTFSEGDYGGARSCVIFDSTCEPCDFEEEHNTAANLLASIKNNPIYYLPQRRLNTLLEILEEEGIVIYEDQPDSVVQVEFNKLIRGFSTYEDHLATIKQLRTKQ